MKKTLLVPTDFSNNSMAAAKYASKLAIERDYSIHLIHYYTTASSSFPSEELSKEFEKSAILKADLTILEFEKKLQEEFPSVHYTHRTSRGLLKENLPLEAKEEGYEAIVMGTKGLGDSKSERWGSNTSSIASKSPIPVLAIPGYYNVFKTGRIALLTNFKEDELHTLNEFIDTFGEINALDLIHVYQENEQEAAIIQKIEAWKSWIFQQLPIENINYYIDKEQKDKEDLDTVPEVIHKLVEQHAPDIVLITKSRKSFFKRLFYPSVSKAVVLDINKPSYFSKVSL